MGEEKIIFKKETVDRIWNAYVRFYQKNEREARNEIYEELEKLKERRDYWLKTALLTDIAGALALNDISVSRFYKCLEVCGVEVVE